MRKETREVIASLGDENGKLLNARLVELSDLSHEELELLDEVWGKLGPKRRQQLMYRLIELVENNIELNFDNIFKHQLKDEDEKVRSLAIEGLWEDEETSLISPLIELLEHDKSERVQQTAAKALGRFALLAEHGKLSPEYTDRINQVLLAIIDNATRPVAVRRRALEAIAPMGLPRVRQSIADAYRFGNPALKASAIYAMGKNCDPYWLPLLQSELGSADAELRYEAAAACGELGEEEAVPSLIALTSDSDTDVQLAAIQALGKIGGREAREHLLKCLAHQSEAVREAASHALHELEVTIEPLSPDSLSLGDVDDQ